MQDFRKSRAGQRQSTKTSFEPNMAIPCLVQAPGAQQILQVPATSPHGKHIQRKASNFNFLNENEHVSCGLFYHFGPKSAIRAPKIVPKRAVLCAREIIRGPVEPFCWAPRVGPPWPDPPGPKKVPKYPGMNFSRTHNLPKRPPRRPPAPRGAKIKAKEPLGAIRLFAGVPDVLGGWHVGILSPTST